MAFFMFNPKERDFFAKLSSPWYIEHKNNDRFEVVYRLEIIRNQIRKWEIEIADYKKEKENLGRYCHHHHHHFSVISPSF